MGPFNWPHISDTHTSFCASPLLASCVTFILSILLDGDYMEGLQMRTTEEMGSRKSTFVFLPWSETLLGHQDANMSQTSLIMKESRRIMK